MNSDLESLVEFLVGSRTAASEMPWGVLREEDVRVIREWVRETQPYSEQRRILTALRRTLRRFPEQPDDDPFLAKTPVTRLRAPKRPASSVPQLTTREARLLLETCGDRSRLAECRNDAMLALMLLAGLRRVEVTELKRSNYEDEDGVLRVGSRHRASRAVIVRGPCEDYLQRWLARRGSSPGPMFLSLAADGELKPVGLSPSTVNRVLADRACRVGCSGVTPRSLRGRFLWQLRARRRTEATLPCRYYQTEDGQPAWSIVALAEV